MDDIDVVRLAERTPGLDVIKSIFDPNPKSYDFQGRPVLTIYSKLCGFIFGEAAHYYRFVKTVLFSMALCLMLHLIARQGGNAFIGSAVLAVFATFPAVVIVTAWINEAAGLEIFFRLIAFLLFFALIRPEKRRSVEYLFFGGLIVLVTLVATKTKITALTIPPIFVTYLLVTKNRNRLIYLLVSICLLAVFPYSAFFGKASGVALVKSSYYADLFKTFLSHTWPLVVGIILCGFLSWKRDCLKDKVVIFASVWLFYDLCFYVAYPSNEMRYLFSSLAASSVLIAAISAKIFRGRPEGLAALISRIVLVSILLATLCHNTFWTYNFRGSFGGTFITYGKKMDFIERRFDNSLCLYASFTANYFERNGKNRYVDLHPRYRPKSLDEILQLGPKGIRILRPELYENVIVLDESLPLRFIQGVKKVDPVKFDSVIEGSLYDLVQGKLNADIRGISLYDLSLKGRYSYPARSYMYRILF